MSERRNAHEMILGIVTLSREAGLDDRHTAACISTVLSSEGFLTEVSTIEARVRGAYKMLDGRTFWIDAPVAREIARRAVTETSEASA